uniref:Fatty acid hydroxylase domain-containing protein n=1 Tax=Physcomitrium patens TaxID=3218 RepID=A0A2K1KNL6_PHYPA|nr:hypothetical protein PHYPA_006271 [Physcomitrium patens]
MVSVIGPKGFITLSMDSSYPMDPDRLVFPTLFTAAISSILWKIVGFDLKPTWNSSIYGGIMFGYVCYDHTHYYLHFAAVYSSFLYKMKKEHLNHHFKNGMHHYGFGVTSSFWVTVFGTLPPAKDTHKGSMITSQTVMESISPTTKVHSTTLMRKKESGRD